MKTPFLFLALLSLVFLLGACSASNCTSVTVRRSGNLATGRKPADATTTTLCTDKTDYNKGDLVHITFTVKNLLDEQMVLDGGQQPVMDLCVSYAPCLSHYQAGIAQLTHLELAPGQSYTIQWDWPPPNVDMNKSVESSTNAADVRGQWISFDKQLGTISVGFAYGPRRDVP